MRWNSAKFTADAGAMALLHSLAVTHVVRRASCFMVGVDMVPTDIPSRALSPGLQESVDCDDRQRINFGDRRADGDSQIMRGSWVLSVGRSADWSDDEH